MTARLPIGHPSWRVMHSYVLDALDAQNADQAAEIVSRMGGIDLWTMLRAIAAGLLRVDLVDIDGTPSYRVLVYDAVTDTWHGMTHPPADAFGLGFDNGPPADLFTVAARAVPFLVGTETTPPDDPSSLVDSSS